MNPQRIMIRLGNVEDRFYFGRISVGEQVFDVSFDTGMHDIWIPEQLENVIPAALRSTYNYMSDFYTPEPGNASQIRRNDNLTLTGTRRTDSFSIGPLHNRYQVPDNEFVVYDVIDPALQYYLMRYDGFVGLRLPTPGTVGADPIWMRMMNEGRLARNLFSLYLRYRAFGNDDGGAIMFGGINRNFFHDPLRYYNLVHNTYKWMLHVHSVSVAGFPALYCDKAEIDSGCNYIYGPAEIISVINRQIVGREVPLHGPTFYTDEEWTVTSEHFPAVAFTFTGGEEYPLNMLTQHYCCADDQVEGRFGTVFRPRVFQPGEEPYFILGTPWLRRYHTVFDFGNSRIGFARSVV